MQNSCHKTRNGKPAEFTFLREPGVNSPRRRAFSGTSQLNSPQHNQSTPIAPVQPQAPSKAQLYDMARELEATLSERETELKRQGGLVKKLEIDCERLRKTQADDRAKCRELQRQLNIMGDMATDSYRNIKELTSCCFAMVRAVTISLA